MDKTLPDIGVFILGVRGALRNPALVDTHLNPEFVSPVFLDESTRATRRVQFTEYILNGHRLSKGERGCSLAHIDVRRAVANSSFSWNLVLEDDAGLPADWRAQLYSRLVTSLEALEPGVILLNTNPYFDLSYDCTVLNLKPSLANAFLIHRDVVHNRPHSNLERYEIADWPISFADVKFWTISRLAFDLNLESVIGFRKRSRVSFLLSLILRALFSPILTGLLGVPWRKYLRWSIVAPIRRDLGLRVRAFRNKRLERN
jgi:hypothetical protein